MKVKVFAFQSVLKHSPTLQSENTRFLQDIGLQLGTNLDFADIDDYDCDVKLLFVQTGGSEGYFLENIDKLQEPYYILTNGANNSLAASMEILTYLNLHGKKGEILHGNTSYIADRIKTIAQTESFIKQLKNSRLGIIGKPSDWLIASVPDYGEVQKKLGVKLIDIPLNEVETKVNASTAQPDINGYKPFDKAELLKAACIRDALYEIVKEHNLNGLTIRCFDLLSSLKSTGCLALAELNTKGVVGTCEGDVAAMLSMHIATLISGQSCFQANPSRMDTQNNTIVFAHCTAPFDMLEDYSFDTHFESGIGVAVKGKMKKQQVTLFRLSQDLKKFFVSGGVICNTLNESNLCRTQINVKLDKPVTELLTNPCGNHHIIIYGDYAQVIERIMNILLSK
ncbi:MAG: hypothetical protein K2L12_04705 [Clostridia bacterium]|nr:hypothetical protein [Clostridia bacterium]